MRSQLLMLTAMLLLQACQPLNEGPNDIFVTNYAFSPPMATVSVNRFDTVAVSFRWAAAAEAHNITWDSGPGTLPANSPTMSGGTYMVTLVPGTYVYHCEIHDASLGMRGTIVVQPFTAASAF